MLNLQASQYIFSIKEKSNKKPKNPTYQNNKNLLKNTMN